MLGKSSFTVFIFIVAYLVHGRGGPIANEADQHKIENATAAVQKMKTTLEKTSKNESDRMNSQQLNSSEQKMSPLNRSNGHPVTNASGENTNSGSELSSAKSSPTNKDKTIMKKSNKHYDDFTNPMNKKKVDDEEVEGQRAESSNGIYQTETTDIPDPVAMNEPINLTNENDNAFHWKTTLFVCFAIIGLMMVVSVFRRKSGSSGKILNKLPPRSQNQVSEAPGTSKVQIWDYPGPPSFKEAARLPPNSNSNGTREEEEEENTNESTVAIHRQMINEQEKNKLKEKFA